MKKILAIVLITILPVFITGCFSFTKVSYINQNTTDANTGKSSTADNVSADNVSWGVKPDFKFAFGKITYTGENNTDSTGQRNPEQQSGGDSQESAPKELTVKNTFKNVAEFDSYVQDIMKQSDWAMRVTDSERYTREEIKEALKSNNSLIDTIRKIQIPDSVFKTDMGKYYANRYAKVELESLIVLRSELLDNMGKNIGRNNNTLNEKISTLRDGAIPIKEEGINFLRNSMMEEEGYAWSETSEKYVPNN